MLDAQAKPPPGILDLNFNWIGNVPQCESIRSPGSRMWNIQFEAFSGKYCSARFKMGNQSLAGPTTVQAAYGFCVPDTCSFQNVNITNFNEELKHYSANIPYLNTLFQIITLDKVECLGESDSLSAGAIVVIIIYVLIAMVVLTGTLLDYLQSRTAAAAAADDANRDNGSVNTSNTDKEVLIHNAPRPDVLTKFLLCFSLKQHLPKVLSLESRQQDLACLHGIRVLSISWVVLGHTYFGYLYISNNLPSFVRSLDNLPGELLLQAPLSVDSFFVLSGLLMTYLFLTQAQKIKINWPLFYVHRYLRLTPTYMLILAFWAAIYPYLGSGPLWSIGTRDNCNTAWWQNLLYINNFYDVSCMGWAWYLANDMQFFVISPLFLIPLMKRPRAGLAVMAALTIISWVTIAGIVDYYHIVPVFQDLQGGNLTAMKTTFADQQRAMTYIYTKPYCRIAPYLIGAATGYLIYRTRQVQEIVLSKIQVVVGWIFGVAFLLVPIFSMYHAPDNRAISVTFMMWHRSSWAIGLCWVIFACLTGHGGVVNQFLSLPHWLPLSRLTYCLYLIHLIIIFTILQSLPNLLPFSSPLILVMFGGFLWLCYLLSLLATLLFESPVMALEKWALGRQ